jgi:trans-2-enoyl-CoA reductase
MSTNSAAVVTHAAVYEKHGDPSAVLEWKAIALPHLGSRDVQVALESSVIHPSDFGMIAGTYGRPRPAPAVAGREGVGRVERVGVSVTRFSPGERVRMPTDEGVWCERGIYSEDALIAVPDDLEPEAAAQSFVNPPAAIRLLEDFVKLSPGDIVIQNAGNSAVGRAVAFLAHRRGLRVFSLVRDTLPHAVPLRKLGAEHVFRDDDELAKHIEAVRGTGKIRLALNSIGGASVMRLVKVCDPCATIVTFGGMTGEPVRFPTRELIFKDITLRGFWIDGWVRSASREEVTTQNHLVYEMWRHGFPTGVEQVYPISEIQAAVAHALRPGRTGKILLRGPAWVEEDPVVIDLSEAPPVIRWPDETPSAGPGSGSGRVQKTSH